VTFQTPWAAIIGAAVAIPLLLVLYFLKLRRLPRRIPSTLLWMKAVEDLQVNAPFQRLRLTLLFLLQLLMLILLILALGQPVIEAESGPTRRTILLIDRSASMNTRVGEVDGSPLTRLDRAKAAATEIVQRLGRSEQAAEMMVVAFGRTAQVVSGFETDRDLLTDAIDAIEPTDEPGRLESALQLADAFARAEGEEEAPPVVTLLSDGGVGEPDSRGGFTVAASEFRFVGIGEEDAGPLDNLGVVAIGARRDLEDPTIVDLFVRVANAGDEARRTTLTLRLDEAVEATRGLDIPPAGEDGPGEAIASFEVPLERQAVLTVRQGRDDALPADDLASVVIPAPRSPRVAIISPRQEADPFLLSLFEATEPATLRSLSGEVYANLVETRETRPPFDLVVFDRVTPARLPDVPTLTFGGAPPGVETIEPDGPRGRRFLSWDRRHPLMRHVELDESVYAGFGAFRIPEERQDDFEVLASGPAGPVIVTMSRPDVPHVFVGFELMQSNWPTQVALPVFLQNVLDAAAVGRGASGVWYRPGEPITIEVSPDRAELVISGPVDAVIDVEGRRRLTLPALPRVGVYGVAGALPPHERIALNLADAGETDIRPRENVRVNAEEIGAVGVSQAAPRDLWPWLVAAALVLLVIEWLVYAKRAAIR